jgi:predicted RNase H-like HicB family nuclease
MQYRIEIEQEADGRWLAEVVNLPGAMAYGETWEVAVDNAKALARRIIADRIEHREHEGSSDAFSFAQVAPAAE